MKKLKRLKINKLQDFNCIRAEEQMMMKGGYTVSEAEEMMNNGTWTGGQVYGMGYVGSGVNVYGEYLDNSVGPQSECPQCQQWHQMNSGQPSMSGNKVTTPFGQLIFNTIPHYLGMGNHQ